MERIDSDAVLAFRLQRTGPSGAAAPDLATAAACPASDFSRDAALLALAARTDQIDREHYRQAVDSGDLVVAHVVRGAIHALAPSDLGLYGRALIVRDDDELLGAQLGRQVQRLAAEKGFSPTAALGEVAAATGDALVDGAALDKNALHAALRERVHADLMPWCKGCGSHHVAPMLWRYATVEAGVRLDSERRYRAATVAETPAASDAARRFLSFYGPSTSRAFAEWAGVPPRHAKVIWAELADQLVEVEVDGDRAALLRDDLDALRSPSAPTGLHLLPPGDPLLQKPNRPLIAPDAEIRKRLFRPVASPGAVLHDGRLVGLWRAKAKGRRTELGVEALGRFPRRELRDLAQRLATLRGTEEAVVTVD